MSFWDILIAWLLSSIALGAVIAALGYRRRQEREALSKGTAEPNWQSVWTPDEHVIDAWPEAWRRLDDHYDRETRS